MWTRWSIWSSYGQWMLVDQKHATDAERRAALPPMLALARVLGGDDDDVVERNHLQEISRALELPISHDLSRHTDASLLRMMKEALSQGSLIAIPVPQTIFKGFMHLEPLAPKADRPKETEKGPDDVTVKITAEDGKAPPLMVAISQSIKLKGVPSQGGGTYQWSTTSSLVTLHGPTLQTVTVVAGKNPSAALLSEKIQLVFTPTGKSAMAPVTHSFSVGKVMFQKEASHPWGYDPYGQIPSRDKDGANSQPTPGPDRDFVSIKKQGVGNVSVVLSGVDAAKVFFKSSDESVCKPKSKQPAGSPFVLEIEAMAKDKSETTLEARLDSESGTVLATLGVVVLKEITYLAEAFDVVDSTSAGTALGITSAPATSQSALNDYYKQGVAKWDISGTGATVNVPYDLIKNGMLDMEPGVSTDEQKKIIAACVSTRTRVIHVHKLRWCYYFAQDAAATDLKIKLKNYGRTYLGYIGLKSYTLDDATGQSTTVTVTAVNTSTGELTLGSPLGKSFKVADHAALIWPLGGLSGDPLWVGDKGSAAVLNNYIAHELGHTSAGLQDICELDNLMHGGSNTGSILRHRPLSRYYSPTATEEQWKIMKNR